MSKKLFKSRRLPVMWAIAVCVQSLIALVAITYPSAFGYGKIRSDSEMKVYFGYARPILEGQWPYRDFRVEYPVLAIPFFVAPLIFGKTFEVYKYAFVVEMLAFNALAVWLVARHVEQSEGLEQVPARLAWYSLVFVVLCPMNVTRFDLVPMLLAFAAAHWISTGRMAWGGLAAGLGVLVKIVPGLMIVPLIAYPGTWRPKAKSLAVFAVTVALGGVGWWTLGGEQVLSSFRYHAERGLEIGSLYSSAYLVAHKIAGTLIHIYYDHLSVNVAGPGARDAASLSPILQGALLLLVAGRAREQEPGGDLRFSAAALLAFILAGKVFSPQYMVWLIPFVGVLRGPIGTTARRIFLPCCLLTTALFPYLFDGWSYVRTAPVVVLALRNLGLVWLFAILLAEDA